MKRIATWLLISIVWLSATTASVNGQDAPVTPKVKLATLHGRFVDAESKTVILKGCNLGNWLIIEPWMLGSFDVRDQAELIERLQTRFGVDQTQQLLDTYRDGFIRERDFRIIRSFGFNVVRLPFDYRLLQSDESPYRLKADAFHWLDRAISLASQAGVYVILDLHAAPGGQSREAHTGKAGSNALWSSDTNLQRTADLWHAIAEHYRGNPTVAAYDLLNEPFGDYQQDLRPDLKRLCGRIYKSIRSADQQTIILLPGTLSDGIQFYGTPAQNHFENVGYTEHYYPGLFGSSQSLNAHARLLNQKFPLRALWLTDAQAPYLVGEFNVVLQSNGGDRMMREYYDRFAVNGWASTMWSYKFLKPEGGMEPNLWGMVTNSDPIEHVDLDTITLPAMKAWFDSIGTMRLSVDSSLQAMLTHKDLTPLPLDQFPLLPASAKADPLPLGWIASDIGIARPGGQSVVPDSITICGGGSDIYGKHDSFRFVSQPASQIETFTARVSPPLDSSEYAKAGLMIRSSNRDDAALVMVNLFPNDTIGFCCREQNGAVASEAKHYPGLTGPVALRLSVHGAQVEAYYFDSDGKWTLAGTAHLTVGLNTRIGYAVTSHDVDTLTSSTFHMLSTDGAN